MNKLASDHAGRHIGIAVIGSRLVLPPIHPIPGRRNETLVPRPLRPNTEQVMQRVQSILDHILQEPHRQKG